MKIPAKIPLILTLFTLFINAGLCHAQCVEAPAVQIITSPQKIMIVEEGIFVLHDGHVYRVTELRHEGDELMATINSANTILSTWRPSPQGLEACHFCHGGIIMSDGRCSNPDCPSRKMW